MPELQSATTGERAGNDHASFLLAVLMIALVAVAGSLWLSVGMGLKACPLCFYQRSFVMGVAAVLMMGLAMRRGLEQLIVLALPMAVAALGVALFHVYLESSGKLECPAGIFGIGTAPQQSLAILLVLVIAMSAHGFRDVFNGSHSLFQSFFALVIGTLLGGLIAFGSIASAPPLPKAPSHPYETVLDTCRPPFQAIEQVTTK